LRDLAASRRARQSALEGEEQEIDVEVRLAAEQGTRPMEHDQPWGLLRRLVLEAGRGDDALPPDDPSGRRPASRVHLVVAPVEECRDTHHAPTGESTIIMMISSVPPTSVVPTTIACSRVSGWSSNLGSRSRTPTRTGTGTIRARRYWY